MATLGTYPNLGQVGSGDPAAQCLALQVVVQTVAHRRRERSRVGRDLVGSLTETTSAIDIVPLISQDLFGSLRAIHSHTESLARTLATP